MTEILYRLPLWNWICRNMTIDDNTISPVVFLRLHIEDIWHFSIRQTATQPAINLSLFLSKLLHFSLTLLIYNTSILIIYTLICGYVVDIVKTAKPELMWATPTPVPGLRGNEIRFKCIFSGRLVTFLHLQCTVANEISVTSLAKCIQAIRKEK